MKRGKGRAFFRTCRRALSFLFPLLAAGFILWREPPGYALFLFAAVVLHEVGHLFAFFLLGLPSPAFSGRAGGLLLSPTGGALSYRQELFVAAAGPLFNLLAAIALLPALHAGGGMGSAGIGGVGAGSGSEASFCYFALNLLCALFNLLPIAGFDGGRVLFCLSSLVLSPRASRVFCDAISAIFLIFFYFAALFLFLFLKGAEYSFLFALFLLSLEAKRTGAISFDFESI